MNELDLRQVSKRLLPGFGFFAPGGPLRLPVNVGKKLKRVSFVFETTQKAGAFSVPWIEFIDENGKRVDKNAMVERVRLIPETEEFDEEQITKRFLTGRQFRTARAKRPRFNVIFKEPIKIKRIMLGSRFNDAKLKSRHFAIEGFFQKRTVFEYRNMSTERRVDALARYCDSFGLSAADYADAETFEADFNAAVSDFATDDNKTLSPRQMCELLPLFDEAPEYSETHQQLLSKALAQLLSKKGIVSTSTLAPMRRFLNSPERIEHVVAGANKRLSEAQGRDVHMVAGKHAIQESQLVREKERYLKALDAIFPALKACGVQPMLAYGSLLGAVRENAFLMHDDDVDLLYYDGSTSREDAIANRDKLMTRMEAHGYRVTKPARNENIHLSNGDANLDLFPCWEEGDQLYVMRRYPSYEPLPKSWIVPCADTTLYSRTYPAPSDAAAFLEWRYGEGWDKPDPYYEWPWKLAQS